MTCVPLLFIENVVDKNAEFAILWQYDEYKYEKSK